MQHNFDWPSPGSSKLVNTGKTCLISDRMDKKTPREKTVVPDFCGDENKDIRQNGKCSRELPDLYIYQCFLVDFARSVRALPIDPGFWRVRVISRSNAIKNVGNRRVFHFHCHGRREYFS